jgi:uncharacterized protein with NRDE domain
MCVYSGAARAADNPEKRRRASWVRGSAPLVRPGIRCSDARLAVRRASGYHHGPVCTLAVYLRVFADHPLVVAANRDEQVARPAEPPQLLRTQPPRVFGGRDAVAGGTWLGVAERGVVAGLLNRHSPAPLDPSRRSRGRLCLDALVAPDAASAATAAGAPGPYNPFNLLVADAEAAFVVSQAAGEAPRRLALEPGLHVLSNLDVDDPRCPRIAASRQAFSAAGASFGVDGDVDAFVGRLRAVLADHRTPLDPRGPGSLCVHGDGYGTRSSSVILLGPGGRSPRWYHADGPPCRTPLARVAVPF